MAPRDPYMTRINRALRTAWASGSQGLLTGERKIQPRLDQVQLCRDQRELLVDVIHTNQI